MREIVVMVTTSYPRFPGDGVGSFMEPIAKGVAARGHDVHVVAPWHPAMTRRALEDGVHFHFFRYAPIPALHVFGYSGGLRADTELRASAWAMAPLALAAGWRCAARVAAARHATVMHGHWVVPGGVMAALAARGLPLVVSLHGSDVFVAERSVLAGRAARAVFRRTGWVTACSNDLARRAAGLGADPARIETVPYGVDAVRFAPDAAVRAQVRRELGVGDAPLVVAAGRLVRKKGFEYLIDAVPALTAAHRGLHVVIAGGGGLREELSARAAAVGGGRVVLLGTRSQDDIARLAAAADVIAVPSIHDESGNVDGLPNFALEALASATPVVAARVGGLPELIRDGSTGLLVPERDAAALAGAISELLADRARAAMLGAAARARVVRDFGWNRVAERLEAAYARARG
jgi:glycosyltransferase involved in cell wall biosynthesis